MLLRSNLSLDTYDEIPRLLALETEWNSLLERSKMDTIFLTWQWQKIWWDFFGREAQLSIVTVRDGDELIGLAPFYALSTNEGPKTLRLIGGVEVSDYLDIIVSSGKEEVVYKALWEFLIHECDYPWEIIDLHNIPAASPTRTALPSFAKTTKEIDALVEVEDVCPIIDLPSGWEEYLSALNKKQRHEVRRKIRKANKEATVHWYYVQDERAILTEMQDFIELHKKSGQQKKDFMAQSMQSFFQAMARAACQQGWLKLYFLLINGIKTAAMLCFDYGNSLMVYNSGYDPQLHASLSPGTVLLAYCIQDAIRRGLRTLDFLRGDEEYKYRLGGKDTEVYNLTISR
jgi:CelD/BcsL family acetyltransferase involved in cellulose biosynthesis